MFEHVTLSEVMELTAILSAVVGANAGLTTLLVDRKLKELNGTYVRSGECVLKDGALRQMVQSSQAEGQMACLAATQRDTVTQARIDDLVQSIAARTADTILRDREILNKIDLLLMQGRE